MGPEILVPLAFIAFLGAVIITPMWLRERTKQSAHSLISQAIEKGQPLDPHILERLTSAAPQHQQPGQARRTLGSGIVLLALGLGFAVVSALNGEFYSGDGKVTAAIILGVLGLAFTGLGIFDYVTRKKPE